MIIRLKTANFSDNNIGELNKFTIYCHGTGLADAEFTSPVEKGSTATIKVTLNSGFSTGDIQVTMKGNPITPSISSTGTNEYTITIPNVTGKIVVLVGDVVSGGEDEPTDPEIGTTTTIGSNNIEVVIIGDFSEFNFTNKTVISTSGGSSCVMTLSGSSGRESSGTQVLKVVGGSAYTFTPVIDGLQYALIEFTDKPCVHATLNKSGLYGQAWSTASSGAIHADTKYLGVNFNTGSSDLTDEELALLKTAIVIT